MIRAGYLITTTLMASGILVAVAVPPPVKVIWNVTASVPVGFYTLEPARRVQVPELVAVRLPEPITRFMVERGYIAPGVPLMKRVVGLPGQRVCRAGRTITVDGVTMGAALERDHMGRDLPVWRGCRRLAGGELFLMNWEVEDSLDSRYFGPISANAVVGRALPLWTDENGDGHFVWRAPTH